MCDLQIYVGFVITILGRPDRKGAAIEYTKHHGLEIPGWIFRTTKARQKHTRWNRCCGPLSYWRWGMRVKDDHYTYRVTWSEEDSEYVGLCAEFPSLSWLAKTHESALKGIRKVVAEVIEDLRKNKEEIPEPLANRHYSGKFVVRVTPETHRELSIRSAEAGISLNRLVSDKLSRGRYH
jgi:predicted HicB family RNase H-like nuclease